MKFRELSLKGAFLVEMEPHRDDRGCFARSWCHREARQQGIELEWVQSNISWNERTGTMRGLHYQAAPHQEAKLIRCSRGAIFDVLLDLRPGSPTYGRWESVELGGAALTQLYAPTGVAHGFQVIEAPAEVLYLMSEYYHPEGARGVNAMDPQLGIPWPLGEGSRSPRDAALPPLRELD